MPKQPVVPDAITNPPTDNYQYPWSWAESTNRGHGQEVLRNLSDKAQSGGHDVVWHGVGANQWLEIDGHSDTKTIVNILNNFKG